MNTLVSNIRRNSEVKCSASTTAEEIRSYISKVSDNYPHKMNHYKCITAKIAELALKHPNKLAIDDESNTLCYQKYYDSALVLASHLKSLHLGAEDKVVVFLDISQHMPIALLSILMAGGVYVPIDTSWPKNRIDTILQDVSPKVILTQTHYYQKFSSLNSIHVLDLDDKKYKSRCDYSYISSPNSTDTAVIFYTSGSTGMPKGVELSYGNIQSFIESASKTYRFNSSDIHLSIAKYSFSISLFDLLLPFYCGGSLKLRHREQLLNSESLVSHVRGVTCFHMGPALLESLVKYAEDKNIVFPNITHVSSGGDMIPASLLERCKLVYPNAEIWVIYGCTEVACMGTTWQVDKTVTTNTTYVGKAFGHANLLLLDDNLKAVDVGEFGEVYFSGAGVTRGYLNREELNNVKFITIDGARYYATGDFGVLAENGNLQLKGRKDFQIKISGVRIETEEIEYWLNKLDSVVKSIVVGARDKRGDLKVIAFVISNSTFDEVFIKQQLAEVLPSNMVPNKIYAIAELPLNTNGKLDRNSLIAKAEENLKENVSGISSDDEVAKHLLNIWFNAGASGAIYDDSNFFDVGGDSLGAVQLVYTISTDFNIACDFEFIYAHPDFLSQLNAIKNGAVESDSQPKSIVVPLDTKSKDTSKKLFITPGMDGHIVSFHNFGKLLPAEMSAYGLLYPNFANEEYDTITAVAERLVAEILKVQKDGPYYLGGHSSGGIISLEIARILLTMGKQAYLVLIEARIFEKAPRKPLKDVFMLYLKNKPKLYLEKLVSKKAKHYVRNPLDSNNRAKLKNSLKIPKLKGAFSLSKKQLDSYTLKPIKVQAVLIKGTQSIWWDGLRNWPDDYGLGEYVDLISVTHSKGDHVSIAMEQANHPILAKVIEQEVEKFT